MVPQVLVPKVLKAALSHLWHTISTFGIAPVALHHQHLWHCTISTFSTSGALSTTPDVER